MGLKKQGKCEYSRINTRSNRLYAICSEKNGLDKLVRKRYWMNGVEILGYDIQKF